MALRREKKVGKTYRGEEELRGAVGQAEETDEDAYHEASERKRSCFGSNGTGNVVDKRSCQWYSSEGLFGRDARRSKRGGLVLGKPFHMMTVYGMKLLLRLALCSQGSHFFQAATI